MGSTILPAHGEGWNNHLWTEHCRVYLLIYLIFNSKAWECPGRGWDHLSRLWAAWSASFLIPHYVMLEREGVWTFLTQSAGVLSKGDTGLLEHPASPIWVTHKYAPSLIQPTRIGCPLCACEFWCENNLAVINLFIHLTHVYFGCLPSRGIIGAGATEVNKMDQIPASTKLAFYCKRDGQLTK